MRLVYPNLRHRMAQTWTSTAKLYARGPRSGWRCHLLHFSTCLTVSLAFSFLLFLSLRFSLKYDPTVSGSITVACVVISTVALFVSKRVRCFVFLFLISCGLKQGRNLLITAGTSLVIFWNVQNTFNNLKELAMSLICNLEKKRVTFDLTPLSNYIEMLRWVGGQLRFPDFRVFRFNTSFQVRSKVISEELAERLQQGGTLLNATANDIRTAMETLSSIGQKVSPLLGVILVSIVTILYLRQYHRNKKFENVFITDLFVQYDESQRANGRPHVLPLTEKETKRYAHVPSTRLSVREAKGMLKFCLPILSTFLTWVLFIGVDTLFYLLIKIISVRLEELEPFHVPLVMKITEGQTFIGVNINEQNRTRDFSYSMALFEKECLPKPTLLIHKSAPSLSVILLVLTALGLLSSKLLQLRLLVSAEFWPQTAGVRVQYLHDKILRKRLKMKVKAHKGNLVTLLKKVWQFH
ncbi:dendritic cell-specific transmembrane protein-like [Scleropages formosus]|uniref:Dendritic cell-specific transmembrane protein-like n=1 Tax=Scleropages formosus TaxID=113540 RepID=A0A0P7V0H4_SCLFO|nr:dendritic cell-specific transmembrane protein-like [Scleropages formosus]